MSRLSIYTLHGNVYLFIGEKLNFKTIQLNSQQSHEHDTTNEREWEFKLRVASKFDCLMVWFYFLYERNKKYIFKVDVKCSL